MMKMRMKMSMNMSLIKMRLIHTWMIHTWLINTRTIHTRMINTRTINTRMINTRTMNMRMINTRMKNGMKKRDRRNCKRERMKNFMISSGLCMRIETKRMMAKRVIRNLSQSMIYSLDWHQILLVVLVNQERIRLTSRTRRERTISMIAQKTLLGKILAKSRDRRIRKRERMKKCILAKNWKKCSLQLYRLILVTSRIGRDLCSQKMASIMINQCTGMRKKIITIICPQRMKVVCPTAQRTVVG